MLPAYCEVCNRLKYVRNELQLYIDDAHELAYTDALTGSANRNAYIENVKLLDDEMDNTEVDFSIAVFDINGLKNANDTYGHEYGGFNTKGGLRAELMSADANNLPDIAAIDSAVAEANEAADDFKSEAPLAISKGFSSYLKGKDSSVQDVFRRADKAMYDDKTAYYKAHDRRQR